MKFKIIEYINENDKSSFKIKLNFINKLIAFRYFGPDYFFNNYWYSFDRYTEALHYMEEINEKIKSKKTKKKIVHKVKRTALPKHISKDQIIEYTTLDKEKK